MDNQQPSHIWSQVKETFHQFIYSAKKLLYPTVDGPIPFKNLPIVFLSKTYDSDSKDFILDFYSRVWMTYRSGFPPIHGYSSDVGWGCMIRSGQMLIANAFLLHEFKRDWRIADLLESCQPKESRDSRDSSKKDSRYIEIMSLFLDSNTCPLSIQRIALVGQSFDVQIGQWFGPSTISHVLCSLLEEIPNASLQLYLAKDGVVYRDAVLDRITHNKGMLLLIPLRLGVDVLNPIYYDSIKQCFENKYTVGIAGGRPNSSLFFMGYQGDYLLYLDPHHQRPSIPLVDVFKIHDFSSFHTNTVRFLPLGSMDPSLVIGFLVSNEQEFVEFCEIVSGSDGIGGGKTPLFTIEDSCPVYKEEVDLMSDYDE